MERGFEVWTVFQHPAIDGGVIHRDAALLHELFELAVAQGKGHLPADTGQDDVLLKVGSLGSLLCTPFSSPPGCQREIILQKAYEQKISLHPSRSSPVQLERFPSRYREPTECFPWRAGASRAQVPYI